MNRKRISKKRKDIKFVLSMAFLIFFAFLLVTTSIILKNEIIKIDSDIITLQARVDEVKKENDNLEGELLAKQNLDYIESVASNKLGMVRSKATNTKVVNIKASIENNVSSDISSDGDSVDNAANINVKTNLFTWLGDLIN